MDDEEQSPAEIPETPGERPTWTPPAAWMPAAGYAAPRQDAPGDAIGTEPATAGTDATHGMDEVQTGPAAPRPEWPAWSAPAPAEPVDGATFSDTQAWRTDPAAGAGTGPGTAPADEARPWAAASAGQGWEAPAGDPTRRGRRVPVRAIVAAAVLSAVLASGGTYAVVSLTAPSQSPSAPAASLASTASAAGAATGQTVSTSNAVVNVAAEASKSVVTITSTGMTGYSPFSVPETGVGSGFVVSSNGLILTANHVVTGAQSLTVTLPSGRQVSATVVSTDPQHDVALIKANATGLIPLPLGDSGNLTIGETVVAVGSPLGTFYDTVTSGIVSALNRSISVSESGSFQQTQLSGLIQTDAPINPGNSGGPLLDVTGHVIGIVDAQASGAQGIGFAVPINAGKALLSSAPSA